MFAANLSTSSSFISPIPSTSKPYFLSPPHNYTISIQCRAPDFSAASSSSSPNWFQFPDISGPRIPREKDAVLGGGNNGGSSINGKREKKWSRNRESYLSDNSDPLPLPMTYPDTTPISPEEIDRRLSCDPQIEVSFYLILINYYRFLNFRIFRG